MDIFAIMENQLLNNLTAPRNRISTHIIFWVAYLAFFSLLYGNIRGDYWLGATRTLVNLPTTMLATYFTLYLLIPHLLDRKWYTGFTFLFMFTAVAFGYLDRLLVHVLWVPVYMPDYPYDKYPLINLSKALQHTINVYSIVFVAAVIKLVKRNYENERVAQEMKREKLDAELKFLKAQIHPHFLFNTLNSLYALTLQHSSKSSEVVLRLSNLLDYMLYECNVPLIALSKEMMQIQDMIELEKLRYGERLDVSFTQNGESSDAFLPPLLMLPFVENAFKHGASGEIDDAFINIHIEIQRNRLTLRVENSKCPDQSPTAGATLYKKGIGLKNVRRRLDLLYADNYELQVFEEEYTFMIVLRIPLEFHKESPKREKQAFVVDTVN
jgi:sensor histidine kinase YesM